MGRNLSMTGNCISAEYIIELLEKVKDKGRKKEKEMKMCVFRNSSVHIHERWGPKHMHYAVFLFVWK
jgi:hypothetical protein